MKIKNYIVLFLLSTFFIVVFFEACKKDPAPKNPYDDVDYDLNTALDTLDQFSITAIHRDIVFPKCAKPGCHDGHFEPDFRTVESTYSTLVYQPIKKNNVPKTFKYRVVPDSSSKSVFYERISSCCFVNTNDRMPQDNIGVALPDDDLLRIKTWIDNGAKDIFNQKATVPNALPQFPWWGLYDDKFPGQWNNINADTNRINKKPELSVIVATGKTITVIPWLSDDKTKVQNLSHCKLLFSYQQNDFTTPVKTITPVKVGTYPNVIWYSTFNTADFLTDTIVYMRFYCNDGDHATDTEYPINNSPSWSKTYWSLYIKP